MERDRQDRRTDVAGLSALLGPGRVSTSPAERAAVAHDAGLDRGTPLAVIRPNDTDEVARVVSWARGAGVAVVARGAGSGLAGGAVPGPGAVVLALDGLNDVVIDPHDRVAICGPGAVTADVDAAAAPHGLMYPPDPASWRQCTVGGNAATNAGGPRCLKYGVTSAYVQGLTAVLADGAVVHLGGRALDPPGPDLIGLLVGSEGTLAVVTELVLRLVPRPPAVGTLLAAFDGAAAAGAVVADIVARGLVPAALELMDRAMMALVAEDTDGPAPWPSAAAALLIIEVDGHAASIAPQLAAAAAAAEAHGGRCRMATDDAERTALWAGRRRAGLAVLRPTGAYHTADAAVPPSRLPAMIDAVAVLCGAHGRSYGLVAHAGDGNLHPLVPFDPGSDADARAVEACVAEITAAAVAMGGTVSGEHGVGLAKRALLPWLFDVTTISAMHDVKAALDPLGTLNPGKVLPARGDPGAPWPRAEPPPGASPSNMPSTMPSTMPLKAISTRPAIRVAADDLVLAAPGDATLAEAAAAARDAGRLLPLASPWPSATLADVIGRRLEPPWRSRYGGIGDQLLTLSATLPDGRVIHAGRAVRKHVAGYALPRLFVGAGGAMGRIDAVGLRLLPAPPCRASVVIPVDDLGAAIAAAAAARDGLLAVTALLVAPAGHAPGPPIGAEWAIVATAEGAADDVDADLARVEAAAARLGRRGVRIAHAVDDLGGVAVWGRAIWAATGGGEDGGAGVGAKLVRLAVPLSDLTIPDDFGVPPRVADAVATHGPPALIDVGTGTLYFRSGADAVPDAGLDPEAGRMVARLVAAWSAPGFQVGPIVGRESHGEPPTPGAQSAPTPPGPKRACRRVWVSRPPMLG